MIALDTNVLIYACDKSETRRQQIALDLIADAKNGVLLWQVACEFVAASRKLSAQGFTASNAWDRLSEFVAVLRLALPTAGILERARGLHLRIAMMSMALRSHDRVPDAVRQRLDAIVSLTDGVCRAHLTEEYAVLARDLATTLARKRPSPLVQGRAPTWACGITYALGMVKFLFDRAQTLHVSGNDLCALFGVSQSAGSAKAREIMRLLRIVQLDPRWCLPSRPANNPLAWMIEVNGFVVDVRAMPREVQEEAHRLGLIAFVPD